MGKLGILASLFKTGSKIAKARKIVKAKPTFKKISNTDKFKSTPYEKYYEPSTVRANKEAIKQITKTEKNATTVVRAANKNTQNAKTKGNIKTIAGTGAGLAAGYAVSKNNQKKPASKDANKKPIKKYKA